MCVSVNIWWLEFWLIKFGFRYTFCFIFTYNVSYKIDNYNVLNECRILCVLSSTCNISNNPWIRFYRGRRLLHCWGSLRTTKLFKKSKIVSFRMILSSRPWMKPKNFIGKRDLRHLSIIPMSWSNKEIRISRKFWFC